MVALGNEDNGVKKTWLEQLKLSVKRECLIVKLQGTLTFRWRPSGDGSREKEDLLAKYVTDMADMGFGLSREDIMRMEFVIAERMGKSHPFKDESAGRGW